MKSKLERLNCCPLRHPARHIQCAEASTGRVRFLQTPVQQASVIYDLVSGLRRSPLLDIRVNKPLINAPNSFGWHHAHGVVPLDKRE